MTDRTKGLQKRTIAALTGILLSASLVAPANAQTLRNDCPDVAQAILDAKKVHTSERTEWFKAIRITASTKKAIRTTSADPARTDKERLEAMDRFCASAPKLRSQNNALRRSGAKYIIELDKFILGCPQYFDAIAFAKEQLTLTKTDYKNANKLEKDIDTADNYCANEVEAFREKARK